MADRYWVGGAGTWNTTNTANWSDTSGGAGGASVPTLVDDVYFDSASNATDYTITLTGTNVTRSLSINGPLSGSVTFSGGATWQIYGNIFFAASGVVLSGATGSFQALSKIPTTTINTNGVLIGGSFTIGSSAYSPTEFVVWELQSAYTSNGNFVINTGVLNSNSYNITCTNFSFNGPGTTAESRFSPGNSTVIATGTSVAVESQAVLSDTFNLTLTNSVSTVNVNANGKGFKTLTIAGTGANTVTFTGTCFIETFQHTRTSAYTISFNTGANLTVQNWKISGALGAVVTLQLVSTGLYYLNVIKQDAVDYLRISSCISDLTTPAPPFYAGANSTTLGGNGSAIILAALPTPTTYYWVGGSATWNATNTLPWSFSSGGTGGAGVPNAYDDVVFDSNSGGGAYSVNITTNVWANNITAGGTALIYPNFSGGGVNLKGSFARPFAGNNVATGFFTPTGSNVTVASVTTFPAFRLYGAGTVQLQSAITVPNSFTGELRAGTLDLNNYAFTCSTLQMTTVQVKTWMLTNSAVTTNIIAQGDGSCGLTISTGTSTVNITTVSVGISILGSTTSSLQLHNVSFPDSSGGTNFQAPHAPVFVNNLTLPGTAYDNTTGGLVVSLKQLTINGTLTIPAAATPRYRNFFGANSTNGGIISNVILNNPASVAGTTFFGVNFTGAGAPVSGTGIGDGGGNSGIVFTTPKTVYVSSVGNTQWSVAPFATTSGGATADANYPLPQDTVIIDNNSLPSGGSLTAANFPGKIDASARSNPVTISALTAVQSDLTLSSAVTVSGNMRFISFPSSLITFTQNGATFTGSLSLTNYVSVRLGSAASTGSVSHFSGQIDFNGYTFSATSYGLPVEGRIDFGAGSLALTGSSVICSDISSRGLTWFVATGSKTVNVTYSGAAGVTVTFTGPFVESNALDFNYTAGTYTLTDSLVRYRNLNLTGFAGTFQNSTRTIFGSFNVGSTATLSVGGNATTFAATSGTWDITTNGRTLDFPLVFNGVGGTWRPTDALTLGNTRATILTAGTLDLNGFTYTTGSFSSSGSGVRTIVFGTDQISLTGNNTTIWTNLTATNFSYTGTFKVVATYTGGVGGRTLSQGANTLAELQPISTTGSSGFILDTVSTDSKSLSGIWGDVDLTGMSGSFVATTKTLYGNFNAGTTATIGIGSNTTTFAATSGTKTITTNGRTLDFPITFDGNNGTWQLQDAATIGATRTTTLTRGALFLNEFTYTTGLFSSSNSNLRGIDFGINGTSSITLTGSGTVWTTSTTTNFSRTGTPTVNVSNNSATATTVTTGTLTEAQALDFNYTTGTYALTDNNAVYRSLNLTGFAGTLSNSSRTFYGSFNVGSTATFTGNAQLNFRATSGTWSITSNGRTLDFPLAFNGVGGTWQLQDALTLGASRGITFIGGTFNANNYNVTIGGMDSNFSSVRTLALGSGTWTVAGTGASAWTFATSTNATITGTATISMTSASAKTFAGGNLTWPTLNQGGAGALTLSGNNTFTDITSTQTATGPCAITFTAGSTQSVSNFTASGTAIGQLTLGSTTTSPYNLVKLGGGDVNVSYCTISYSNASP